MTMRRDDTVHFIELFREKRCLWDTKNKLYRNKITRKEAALDIANAMSIVMNDGFTEEMVLKKIHSMRTQYRKEVGETCFFLIICNYTMKNFFT